MLENKENTNQQIYEAIVYSSTGNSVNMRLQPSISSKVLYTLQSNTPVIVTKKMNEWSKIQYNNTYGFIMNKFLMKKDFDFNLLTLSKKQKLREVKDKLQEVLNTIQLILNQ